MNESIAAALWIAAREALPPEAFLKRDRGEGLFVTDAPRLFPEADWEGRLAAGGFVCVRRGGLIRLIPGPRWLMALEQRHPVPPDFFCESLMPFRGQAVEAESLSLFASGVRCMMSGEGRAAFRRQVGRRAAQCLRMRRTSPDAGQNGGGLYACGLLNHCMEEDE